MENITITREYPKQPVVAVGVAVVKDGKVLMASREKSPGQGVWTFPGGAVELGETIRAAATREIKEETGLDIEIAEIITVVDRLILDHQGRVQFHYVIIDFAAKWVAGEAQPSSDVGQVRWQTPEEIDDLIFAGLARKAIGQFTS